MNKCPDDKVLNSKTGRCVNKKGVIGKKILNENIKENIKKNIKENKCPDDKILNPNTGRCVKKDGAIGKSLLKNLKSSIPIPINIPIDIPIDIPINNNDNKDCNDVITIPQYKNTCWFNGIIMSIFYSQYSRQFLLKNPFSQNTTVKKILYEILINHYIENDKYIYKIQCSLWNKTIDINLAMAKLKETYVMDRQIYNNISIYDAYIFYCNYITNIIGKQIVSKSYFEKYLIDSIGIFIIDKFIMNQWLHSV